eukprot:2737761-Pyramimonas_sp.AAC.1
MAHGGRTLIGPRRRATPSGLGIAARSAGAVHPARTSAAAIAAVPTHLLRVALAMSPSKRQPHPHRPSRERRSELIR